EPIPVTSTVINGNTCAQCIFIPTEFFHERLIHEHDSRRICGVRISEESAFNQRRLQRAKIIRRNLALFFVWGWAVVARMPAFNRKGPIAVRPGGRHDPAESCTLTSRH